MATPAWFDDVRVLGALPDEELVEALRALGEEHAADRLEAALAEVPHPADRFCVAPRVLEDRAFSHPAQVLGYLDPAPSLRDLRPILPIDELRADQTLLAQRITIGLDGFQAADYPGGQSHRVLFHFAANNGVDGGERLQFQVSRRVDEDQPFLILAQPLFVGLTVGQEGVELRCRTLKVEDERDQEILSSFESEVSRQGLRLLPRRQPAAELSSDMAYLLTETVSRRIRPILDFPVGLVLTPAARSAPLALGTYVAAQVPPGIVTGWDWEDWRYHPLSGQIVGREDPRERFPLNYLVLTVDRHLPRPARDRLGRTVRAEVERPHQAVPVDVFAQAPAGSPGPRPMEVEESPDPCRERPGDAFAILAVRTEP